MSFSTYPANPFPPSTAQMNKGDNEELDTRVQALETAVTNIKDGASIDSFGDVETALATKANNEIIAPLFDATSGVYAVGDLVVYDGGLYQFTTAHETAGAWDSSEVVAVKVSEELATLKSGLNGLIKFYLSLSSGNDVLAIAKDLIGHHGLVYYSMSNAPLNAPTGHGYGAYLFISQGTNVSIIYHDNTAIACVYAISSATESLTWHIA